MVAIHFLASQNPHKPSFPYKGSWLKQTWISPGGTTFIQIDHVLIEHHLLSVLIITILPQIRSDNQVKINIEAWRTNNPVNSKDTEEAGPGEDICLTSRQDEVIYIYIYIC